MAGGHSDWVRDVAWAPSLGLPFHTIASAGQVLFCPPQAPGPALPHHRQRRPGAVLSTSSLNLAQILDPALPHHRQRRPSQVQRRALTAPSRSHYQGQKFTMSLNWGTAPHHLRHKLIKGPAS